MRWRKTLGVMLAVVIVGAGGFATGASAVSTSDWNIWKRFSSNGTALCGQTRVSVNAYSTANYGLARAHERSTDRSGTSCGDNHPRPAQYMRIYMSVFRENVKIGEDNAWNVQGGHAATIEGGFIGYSGYCFRANAVGRQWSTTINDYYAPDEPTRSGWDCRYIET